MTYEMETTRLYLEQLSEKHLVDFHELGSSNETQVWS